MSSSNRSTKQGCAAEANIGYIDSVVSAFRGHEIYSVDPYIDDFKHPTNRLHPCNEFQMEWIVSLLLQPFFYCDHNEKLEE
jgi:hypothetical protein